METQLAFPKLPRSEHELSVSACVTSAFTHWALFPDPRMGLFINRFKGTPYTWKNVWYQT